jgi:hypothetical protein
MNLALLTFATVVSVSAADKSVCAHNLTEFRASGTLKKIYGDSYDAWTKWESREGADILPDGKGSMYVKVPRIGHWLGYKDSPLDLGICADELGKRYFLQNGKRQDFDDKIGDRIELGDGKRSAKFTRAK